MEDGKIKSLQMADPSLSEGGPEAIIIHIFQLYTAMLHHRNNM